MTSKLKALWLSTVLFGSLSSAGLAENNYRLTCDIKMDRGTGVPQFCLSSLGGRPILEGPFSMQISRLNFTLNGSVLTFAPLPENRQNEIEIDDKWETWGDLADVLLDSIGSGSLPYDVIIPYLESTVDSPIASQCGTNKTSGTGDVSVSDLLDEFIDWWTPIILVTALGPVFAIIFASIGTCFCCCRLCGKCRRKYHGKYNINNDNYKCCFILYGIIMFCLIFLFAGVVLIIASIVRANNIHNFDGIINTALNNFTRFVEDTQREVNTTVDRYDEVNAFVKCEINNTHISIGGSVIETFEPSVQPLIDSSLVLAAQLNASIDALVLVNTTVVQLITLTQRLQMELNDITTQTTVLKITCSATPGVLPTICNMIPTTSYAVTVDYSTVDDISAVLTTLQQVDDIKSQALKANDTFYAIPCDIRNQILNQTREILDETNHFQQIIANITADVERDLKYILDEDGFIGDVRNQSSDIQEVIDDFYNPSYAISIVLCSLTGVVIVIVFAGLFVGANGYRKFTEQGKTEISKCGGIILLIAVVLMFVLAVVLLLLSSLPFFMGANMLRVCDSIAEDPPNDLPSYELYTRVVDNSELWGGYLLGCFVLENRSVPLTVTGMLNGCRDNGALYRVAQLAQRPELNLENVTNISSQIPNLDGLFKNLQNEVKFNRDQIFTEETVRSLQDYANAGLQGINYASYIIQTKSIISTLNVNDLIGTLERVHNDFNAANQSALVAQTNAVIETVQRVGDTTITTIVHLTNVLETQILMLNNTAIQLDASVEDIIRRANHTFDELQNSSVVINQTRAVLDRVIAYADSYANWAVHNLENEIGQCRPLYAIHSNVYYGLCEKAVDGINGFWLANGLCVLLYIPTIIFVVWLSDYVRRIRGRTDIQLDNVETFELRENPKIAPRLEDPHWPAHWDRQPIGADGRVETCHVVNVPPRSREYRKALQNFQKTLPSTKCEIIQLRRIQNLDLYQQYSVLKDQMEKTISDNYELERELFHGTKKAVCEQINHQGFNRNYAGTHAALYGKGVYFAVDANYSSRDIYSPKDENGYKYIYISLVLTGEYTEGKADMQVPPPKNPSQNKAILYDSLVNSEQFPQIFVAVKDNQAYPQYLVVCKMKY